MKQKIKHRIGLGAIFVFCLGLSIYEDNQIRLVNLDGYYFFVFGVPLLCIWSIWTMDIEDKDNIIRRVVGLGLFLAFFSFNYFYTQKQVAKFDILMDYECKKQLDETHRLCVKLKAFSDKLLIGEARQSD